MQLDDALVLERERKGRPMELSRTVTRLSWRAVPFKRTVKPVVRAILTSRVMPGCWLRSLRAYRILSFDYGHLRSAASMRSMDAAGQPLPWITYPAIEFLKQLDLSDKTVFEYGSTLFWSRVAKHVDSVEHVDEFYREVRQTLPGNCSLSPCVRCCDGGTRTAEGRSGSDNANSVNRVMPTRGPQ